MAAPTPQQVIVVIDDDPLVYRTLELATGLTAAWFSSGETFRQANLAQAPHAVFIDLDLGTADSGLDLIPLARQQWPFCPVLVITSDSRGESIGQALAAGASDYVKKPIDPKELTARLLARTSEAAERAHRELVVFGDITINLGLDEISGPLSSQFLSHSAMRLLAFLATARGTIVSRDELKRKIWGSLKVTDNALDKKLYDIRNALADVSKTVKLRATYGKGFTLISSATVPLSEAS